MTIDEVLDVVLSVVTKNWADGAHQLVVKERVIKLL